MFIFSWINHISFEQDNKKEDIYHTREYTSSKNKKLDIGDKSDINPNRTSVFQSDFTDTYRSRIMLSTVPKALSLRKGVMDESNSIKKHDSHSNNEKTELSMSDGLKSNLGVEKSDTACPSMCKCKWKRGKETVDCASKGFKTIPYIKDSGTQVCALNDFASNIVWLHHY